MLIAIADAYLTSMGVDISQMTPTQRGQRYVVELLRAQYIAAKRQAQTVTVQSTIDAAVTTATTTATGIV